jgi:hydrogenase maturation protein HypF
MAEHGLDGAVPVIGVAFDGTGYGDDGAIWGGELLLADYTGFRRLAHLGYVPLPGGDAAVHRTYRMALAQLRTAGLPWDERLPCVAACPADERAVLARQLDTGLACVPTSSMGRLFDAVSSLAGVCHRAEYEAQAAMELQAAAEEYLDGDGPVPRYTLPQVRRGGQRLWDGGALVAAVAADVLAAAPAGAIAAGFHRAVAAGVVAAVADVQPVPGGTPPALVVLSGGVFANALLLGLALAALRARGYEVLVHRKVPPNDGGLALGQIVIGARRGAG